MRNDLQLCPILKRIGYANDYKTSIAGEIQDYRVVQSMRVTDMKPINKSQLLTSLEEMVERHLKEAIVHFQNASNASLTKPSTTGGWSIAQCLSHLTSYGDYYLPKLKEKLKTQPAGSGSITHQSTWLGRYLIQLMDSTTSSKKFKAARRHLPNDQVIAHVIVADFIEQQEELLSILRQARQIDLTTNRVPISVAPFLRMNVGDVLQFLIIHNERHIAQAKRNLN